jgi:hypothetical protein
MSESTVEESPKVKMSDKFMEDLKKIMETYKQWRMFIIESPEYMRQEETQELQLSNKEKKLWRNGRVGTATIAASKKEKYIT